MGGLFNMKAMKIEIEGKEYTLGFFTRTDAKRAESKGLEITKGEEKPLSFYDKLFWTGLLAKQPHITEKQAEDLIEKYMAEGGDSEEIVKFLTEQLVSFFKSQNGSKKKQATIVEL